MIKKNFTISFIAILFTPIAGQYAERIREKESSVDYLISKRGCNDYANVSEEELRKFVEEELNHGIRKKRFEEKNIKGTKERFKTRRKYES